MARFEEVHESKRQGIERLRNGIQVGNDIIPGNDRSAAPSAEHVRLKQQENTFDAHAHADWHTATVEQALFAADCLRREAELLGRAIVSGAAREAQRDIVGTGARAVASLGMGIVIGTGLTAASPWVAAGAASIGAVGTASWLWNTFNPFDRHNQERNAAIRQCISSTWYSNDRQVYQRNLHTLEQNLGGASLEGALGLLSGCGASVGMRVMPGLLCKTAPSLAFKFLNQTAINRAFPLAEREFRLASTSQSLQPIHSGQPAIVRVQEILGRSKEGIEKLSAKQSLLIAHDGVARIADGEVARDVDLLACCRPERLPAHIRSKSVVQRAGDVFLEVDPEQSRLRILASDAASSSRSAHSEQWKRLRLGGSSSLRETMMLGDYLKQCAHECSSKESTPLKEALKEHDISALLRDFEHLNFRVKQIIGVGSESIVFELDPCQTNPLFAADRIAPAQAVLKLTNPKYVELNEYHGQRAFDAQRYGPIERGRSSNYSAVLQEKVDIVHEPIDLFPHDLDNLIDTLQRHGYSFYDGKFGAGQVGYDDNGSLVLVDWTAAVPSSISYRDPQLGWDFKPTR